LGSARDRSLTLRRSATPPADIEILAPILPPASKLMWRTGVWVEHGGVLHGGGGNFVSRWWGLDLVPQMSRIRKHLAGNA